MFKTLSSVAEHGPVHVIVSREGDAGKLRVIITRRAGEEKEACTPLSLSILAAAEELDAELPLALAEGLAMSDAPTPTVAEQVKAQTVRTLVKPEVVEMKGEEKPAPKAGRKARAKVPKEPKTKRALKAKAERVRAPAVTPAITPLVKPDETAAPKRRRRKEVPMEPPKPTPTIAPDIGPVKVTAGYEPAQAAPESSETQPPEGESLSAAPPAAARSAENLDLFS